MLTNNQEGHEPSIEHVLGVVLPNGVILEAIYNPASKRAHFAVAHDGTISEMPNYDYEGIRYIPHLDTNIKHGVVSLPTAYQDCYDLNALLEDIRRLIHKYVDLDPAFENLCARYVLLTWFFDKFEKVAYLHLAGQISTGKSRFLKVMGALCYHNYALGVGVSQASLYHVTEMYGGTLTIDEICFDDHKLYSMIINILNGGYERGAGVTRCIGNRYNPVSYNPYGPKIFAGRYHLSDDALASRTISQTSRMANRDIPEYLPDKWSWEEAKNLVNRLIGARLYFFHQVDPSMKVSGLEGFQRRFREILSPLFQVTGTTTVPDEIQQYLKEMEDERYFNTISPEEYAVGKVVVNSYLLGKTRLYLKEIQDALSTQSEEIAHLSTQAISQIVRALGFKPSKDGHGRHFTLPSNLIMQLTARYRLSTSTEN